MMHRTGLFTLSLFILASIAACSKRNHPPGNTASAKPETVKVEKKKAVKTAVPKVITVNDKVAKRSIDGRYYYDLDGHRYWRNNKDGKYYLFNKSMYDDEAFKAPDNQ